MASVVSRKFTVPAKLVAATTVTLVDYNSHGLVVEHLRPLHREDLPAFILEWNGERITRRCRVEKSELRVAGEDGFASYRSTLVFLDPDPDALDTIDRIVERSRMAADHDDGALGGSSASRSHPEPPSVPVPSAEAPLGRGFDLWSEA